MGPGAVTFAITPVAAGSVNADLPQYLQWRRANADLGDAGVQVVDFVSPLVATRGVGENSHVITVTQTVALRWLDPITNPNGVASSGNPVATQITSWGAP